MFSKLIRHDFKATLRIGVPMLIALAIVCVVGALNSVLMTTLMYTNVGDIGSSMLLTLITTMLSVVIYIAIFAIPMVVQVVILVDYYKSTASDEAYLTFTLPVSPTQILFSKLLNGIVWTFIMLAGSALAGGIISFVSFLVSEAMTPPDATPPEATPFDWSMFGSITLVVVLVVLYIIVSIIVSQIMYFMSISLGSSISKKNKAVSAVGFIFLTNFVYGFVNYLIMVITALISVEIGIKTENVFLAIDIAIIIMIVVSSALGALFFFLTRRALEKRLNLA